jgi:hypothetical protein
MSLNSSLALAHKLWALQAPQTAFDIDVVNNPFEGLEGLLEPLEVMLIEIEGRYGENGDTGQQPQSDPATG